MPVPARPIYPLQAGLAVDLETLIDRQGMTPRQGLLVALCFLVVVADGMDVAVMGFLAPGILREWGGSRGEFGWVMGAAPLGLVIGALVAGPLADRFGRKRVLIASVLGFGVFTLATVWTRTMIELAGLRLLTGLGLGAVMPSATTLLSEYAPRRFRSVAITFMFTGFSLGAALVGFIAARLMPLQGWRAVLWPVGGLPLLLVPALALLLPESARFLIARGHPTESIAAVLGRMCRTSFPPGATFVAPEPRLPAVRPIGVLFARGYAVTTAALWVTYFMGLLFIYLMTGWLPTLIQDAGLPIGVAAKVTAMFQVGGVLGALAVGWTMDRARPTWIMGCSYAAGAASLLALGAGGTTAGALTAWVAAAGFFMIGAQTGLNAYAPRCYPTLARATGVSWMLGIGRFGSIAGSMAGGVLLGRGWGFTGIVSALALPAAVAAIAILIARRPAEAAPVPMRPRSKESVF